MIDKLQIIQQRYDEVADLIIQPDIISDQKRYVLLSKEYKDLSKIVAKSGIYKSLLSNITSIINSIFRQNIKSGCCTKINHNTVRSV